MDGPAPDDPASHERSRLAWRCRRGRREWDVLLLGWLERHFDTASGPQRAAFAALIELPDAELDRFLMAAAHPLRADLAGVEPSARRGI
jgi:antitoxin CptB